MQQSKNSKMQMIKSEILVDVAVIGAGTAGLAAYRAAKAAGKRVILIEGGLYGTTCARVGCMPSKLMIAPAEAAHSVEKFPAFGLQLQGGVRVDGKAVMKRVKSERDRFVGFVLEGVAAIPVDDKIDGYAQFVDPHTLSVSVDNVPIARVKAASIVIATGSVTSYPAAWKTLGSRPITSDDVFDWDDLPDSVAIFGPGVIGLELGQALHRLGVRVKVFGRGGGVGPLTDPAVLEDARRVFGAEFFLDTNARAEVSLENEQVCVKYRDAQEAELVEHFDYLLAATGRAANVHHLGLAHTGLKLDHQGVPLFNRETLQCGQSHIFIAGDANADVPFLHEAVDEGRIAGDNAACFPKVRPGVRRAGLAVAFTDPQIAIVGGGYRMAQKLDHVTGSVSFVNQGRSRVMLRNRGMLCVYAEIGTGRFVGAEMLGPDAEHIAHLLAWALQMELTVAQMLEMPFYHPVVEEGLRTALRDAQAKLEAAAGPGSSSLEDSSRKNLEQLSLDLNLGLGV